MNEAGIIIDSLFGLRLTAKYFSEIVRVFCNF